MERNTGQASFTGLMVAATLANSTIIKSVEKVLTLGLTNESTRVPGRTIKWTELAFSAGLTGGSTSVSTVMTTSMVKAFSCGQTVNVTRASGRRDFSTDEESVLYLMAQSSKAYGRRARKCLKEVLVVLSRPRPLL